VRRLGVLRWALLGAVCGILAGCGSSVTDAEPLEWVEPDWFAQVRADQIRIRQWFNDCLVDQGAPESDEIIGSGWAQGHVDGTETAEEIAVFMAAHETCGALFLESDENPLFADEPIGEAAYQRMLETRECVIHNGFDIPEPPPLENWVAMQERWGAFGWINSDLTREEAIALNYACPQIGWGSFNWEDSSRGQ